MRRNLSRAAAVLAVVLSSRVAAAAALTVAVLPIEGALPPAEAQRATRILVETLRGFEQMEVVSLADPAGVLGGVAAARLEACTDDPCRAAAISAIGVKRIVAGEVVVGGTLRLRLVDSSTASAPVLLRVSREIGQGEDRLAGAIVAAARELFPDQPESGQILVESRTEGAEITLDGQPLGPAPVGPVRVRAGKHTVVVRAPGHHPFEGEIDVGLGKTEIVRADLDKNRSALPYYLAAGAVGTSLLGVILGATAQSTASAWDDACGSGACAPGFTRARFDDDQRSVELRTTIANGLFATGAALAVGAVITYLLDPGSDVEAP